MTHPLFARQANAVRHILDRNIEDGRGSDVCVRHEQGALSYSDMLGLAGRAANALTDAGVEQENRVALILADTPELVAAVLGALRIGAVPVPISTGL